MEQTRIIAQQLGNLQTPLQSNVINPRITGAYNDRDEHRSTKSSYFSARSMQRISFKSTHSKSSKASAPSVLVECDGPTLDAAAAIYISPPTSPVTPRVRARSRSAAASLATAQIKAEGLNSPLQIVLNGEQINGASLAPRHVFKISSVNSSLEVVAPNMQKFKEFCENNKSNMIVSTIDGATKLILTQREFFSLADNEVPAMPGGLSSKVPVVKVTLTLYNSGLHEGIDVYDLPVALGDIAARLSRTTSAHPTDRQMSSDS